MIFKVLLGGRNKQYIGLVKALRKPCPGFDVGINIFCANQILLLWDMIFYYLGSL